MSFTDLAQSVQNFATSLGQVFSGGTGNGPPYQQTDYNGKPFDILNAYNTANWNKIIGNAYTFKVVDQTSGKAIGSFQEFALQINPSDLTQEEEFAINITPTIDGVVSEHNGIIFRDINISGTTGMFPGKGSGGATAAGKPIGNDANKNKTGFEHFNQLRNYFRAYAQYKKSFTTQNLVVGQNPVLVFTNRKDTEYLIVEPLRFVMRKSGNRGMLYDYNISLKAIGNFIQRPTSGGNTGFLATLGKIDDAISDINDKIATCQGLLLAGSALLGQVESEVQNTLLEPLRQLGLSIKTLQGIGLQINDMGNGLINTLNNSQVLQMLTGIQATSTVPLPSNLIVAAEAGSSAILALGAANLNSVALDTSILSNEQTANLNTQINNALQLPRSFYSDLAATVTRIGDNAADAFGLGDIEYNIYANRVSTYTPPSSHVTTYNESSVMYGISVLQSALNSILAFTGNLSPSDSQTRITAIEANFNNSISIPIPPSVTEIQIPTGATLEDLAQQYLGDYSRWIELVELNNLIPPYISPVGGSFAYLSGTIAGTLTPVILTAAVPGSGGNNITLVFTGTNTIATAIITWNTNNPTNTVLVTSGDLTQIPTQQSVSLNDGITDPRVLAYGDFILLPSTATVDDTNTRIVAENNYTENLSTTEQRMGIDIMMSPSYDFMFGNNQDVQLIVGGDNAEQAINIKIRLDKGDLRYHPEIGLGINVGDKITSLDTIYDNVVQTILSDPRFQQITGFVLNVDGSTVFLTVHVLVANSATPVPLNIAM